MAGMVAEHSRKGGDPPSLEMDGGTGYVISVDIDYKVGGVRGEHLNHTLRTACNHGRGADNAARGRIQNNRSWPRLAIGPSRSNWNSALGFGDGDLSGEVSL